MTFDDCIVCLMEEEDMVYVDKLTISVNTDQYLCGFRDLPSFFYMALEFDHVEKGLFVTIMEKDFGVIFQQAIEFTEDPTVRFLVDFYHQHVAHVISYFVECLLEDTGEPMNPQGLFTALTDDGGFTEEDADEMTEVYFDDGFDSMAVLRKWKSLFDDEDTDNCKNSLLNDDLFIPSHNAYLGEQDPMSIGMYHLSSDIHVPIVYRKMADHLSLIHTSNHNKYLRRFDGLYNKKRLHPSGMQYLMNLGDSSFHQDAIGFAPIARGTINSIESVFHEYGQTLIVQKLFENLCRPEGYPVDFGILHHNRGQRQIAFRLDTRYLSDEAQQLLQGQPHVYVLGMHAAYTGTSEVHVEAYPSLLHANDV